MTYEKLAKILADISHIIRDTFNDIIIYDNSVSVAHKRLIDGFISFIEKEYHVRLDKAKFERACGWLNYENELDYKSWFIEENNK